MKKVDSNFIKMVVPQNLAKKKYHYYYFFESEFSKTYLNDLERGLMDGERRPPSSSIKLGLESFDEKCRGNAGTLESSPPPRLTGVPTEAPTTPPWCIPPAAPN